MIPFASNPDETVQNLGEREMIRRIHQWLTPVCPPPPEGIGDDAAVIPFPAGERLLVTTDPVIYGRHFNEDSPPDLVGAKLLKRNLSDIAAMGGNPLAGVVSLFLPQKTAIQWLERFHAGLVAVARQFEVTLNGGDICETADLLGASLTLTGATRDGRAATRTGAAAGDRLYVTGSLGGSLLGRHLTFEPRINEGAWLARQENVKAMMDLSDGLAKDLLELIPEKCKANIDIDALPVSSAAVERSKATGRQAVSHALCDGEDYELLFALDAQTDPEEFLRRWRKHFSLNLACIGTLVTRPEQDVTLISLSGSRDGCDSLLQGYEHFR